MIWDVAQPRYSSGYFPLRNRPSILIEMHAHKPFRDRVLANRTFMEELILEVGRSGKELDARRERSGDRVTALGRADAEPSEVVVRWGVAAEGETITWPASEWTVEDSVVTGGQRVEYHPGTLREVELEWRHLPVAELTLARPRGYVVLAGWPQIEEVVAGHGLRVYEITQDTEIEVETIRLSKPEVCIVSFQGVVMVEDFESAARPRNERSRPAACGSPPTSRSSRSRSSSSNPKRRTRSCGGASCHRSSSARSTSAATSWRDSPARCWRTRRQKEWETALEDPEFATDSRARYLWWYRRTPYWDETVGLLPVMRVMTPPRLRSRAVARSVSTADTDSTAGPRSGAPCSTTTGAPSHPNSSFTRTSGTTNRPRWRSTTAPTTSRSRSSNEALSLCRGRVLDLGAGAGRHALELQGRGHEVTAIDVSREAVEVMRERGVRDARCGDLDAVDGERFDTILLLMHGIGLVGTLTGWRTFSDRPTSMPRGRRPDRLRLRGSHGHAAVTAR